MRGLMMDTPLMISSLIKYAAEYHGNREIVSRLMDGSIHRANYRDTYARTQRLANALQTLGVRQGDRVATIAWNNHRHFEIYFAVPGIGAVCHTINPRLFGEQIVYIANHAEDRFLFPDLTFVTLVEGIADQLETVEGFVLMCGRDEMPETTLTNVMCYEDLIATEPETIDWPTFDENTASSLCYTSGTTGNPKGVLYSHRSTVLHTLCVLGADTLGIGNRDTLLAIVPMFHANCWGTPYACAACGAGIVYPGPFMDGEKLHELIEAEGVTIALGVPTVWLGLINYLKASGKRINSIERTVIGGTAIPESMMRELQEDFDVEVFHAWGMTETSPLGTTGQLKAGDEKLDPDARYALKLKQGRGIYGIEMRIVDDDGGELPRDGKTSGELMVRGPWVASGYLRDEGGDKLDAEGWFPTGDIATLDPEGRMHITDRAKDVIKSGGEWISSIELENSAMGHPGVAEAAVIGLPHPKWDERPLLVVVRADGAPVTKDEMITYLTDKVAKWWLPDDVTFVDELPHTPTGKVLKTRLREQFADYRLPTAGPDTEAAAGECMRS